MSDAVAPLSLRLAGPTDLEFVMATERLPGYDTLTARWTQAEHLAALQREDNRYLIGDAPGGAPVGFAILERITDRHEGAKLKRIAVVHPGSGVGQRFMREILAWVFGNTSAPRIWLDVFVYNERARHVYRRVGFRDDGLLRQAYVLPDGERVDRVIMSLLRSEWASR